VFTGTQLGRAGAEGLADLERAKQGIALLASNGVDPAVRAQALVEVGYAYSELREDQAALDAFEAALQWTHDFDGAPLMRSRALATRADLLIRQGKFAEAEASSREALEALRGFPSGHPEVVWRMTNLGSLLHRYGRRPEGREWLARSLAGTELAFRPGSLAIDNARLSSLHAAIMDGAAADVRRALPTLAPHVADERRSPTTRINIGWAVLRWHLLAKDIKSAEKLLATLETLAVDSDRSQIARLNVARARAALLRGAIPEAREWAKRAGELAETSVAGGHTMPAEFASLQALIRHERLLAESEIAEWEHRFAAAIDLANESAHRSDSASRAPYAEEDDAASARRLGEARLAAGDATGAQEPLAMALAIYVREHHPSSPLLAETRAAVARCRAALAAPRRPVGEATGKSPSGKTMVGQGG